MTIYYVDNTHETVRATSTVMVGKPPTPPARRRRRPPMWTTR